MKAASLALLVVVVLTQNSGQSASLLAAIKKSDVAQVKRLLAGGADPNAREVIVAKPSVEDSGGQRSQGDTALIVAVNTGSLELVKLLVQKGAKVNLPGQVGFTPLIYAAERRKPAIVKFLLARGAKVDQMNGNGDTALVFAANGGDNQAVELLLAAKANINGGTGWTPLMEAAYNWNVDTVKLLLKKGADPNFLRSPYMSPLECAEAQGNDEIAKLLRAAGGKGRTKEQIQREADKMAETLKKEQADRAAAAKASNPEEFKLTETDREVIECVATDLSLYKGKDFELADGKTLYLIDVTQGNGNEDWDVQMNSELEAKKAADVTVEMRQQWIRRSMASFKLSGLKPAFGNVILAGKEKSEGVGLRNWTSNRWVQVAMPGYSKDARRAVLRFWYGPTPHGAAGTYLLEKRGNIWQVMWRDFAHYA